MKNTEVSYYYHLQTAVTLSAYTVYSHGVLAFILRYRSLSQETSCRSWQKLSMS